MKLELSFKDKPRFEAIHPVPAPVPTAGMPFDWKPPFVRRLFVVVYSFGYTPDFGRFYGSRGSCMSLVALAKNLPHRSRENELRTDGLFFSLKNIRYNRR